MVLAAMTFIGASGAHAETIEAGPFSVDVSAALTIRCNDTVLFKGDRCVAQGDKVGSNQPSLVGSIEDATVTRDGNSFTAIAREGRNSLRREVMVTPEAVHVTFEAKVFGKTGGANIIYELFSPLDSLDGTEYTATAGWLRRPRTATKEQFDSSATEPHEYILQYGQYFVLKSPRLRCTLDFNPSGPWIGISNYGEIWNCLLYHDGERFIFGTFCAAARHGATFTGKIIIRPGDTPYEVQHTNESVAYTTDFPAALSLNFTETDEDDRYRICGAETGHGWQNPEDVRIVTRGVGGLLRRDFAAPIEAEREGILEIALRSGLYLLTLNVYDANEDTGPFDLSGPDGPLLQDVRIPRGTYWDKTVPLRIRDGKAALQLNGRWKINALSMQILFYDEEDFLFERPYWNMGLKSEE
jgi:hypothetical protein